MRDNLLLVMMNHEYGIKPFDAAQVTEATVRARGEMNKIVNGLRKLGGPWEGMQIAATAEQIGVRDGRRIAGRYTVNKDDLVAGARHDDAVVRPTFPVDIHALSAEHNKTAAYSQRGREGEALRHPAARAHRQGRGRPHDGGPLHQRRLHRARQLPRDGQRRRRWARPPVPWPRSPRRARRLPHEVPWSEGAVLVEKLRKVQG